MKPRWQLKKDKIAQILEMHGLEVRMWDVEDGIFLGAIVDGYKPDFIVQQVNSADSKKPCDCEVSGFTVFHKKDCEFYE